MNEKHYRKGNSFIAIHLIITFHSFLCSPTDESEEYMREYLATPYQIFEKTQHPISYEPYYEETKPKKSPGQNMITEEILRDIPISENVTNFIKNLLIFDSYGR